MPEPQYPGKAIMEEKIESLFREIYQISANMPNSEISEFLLPKNQAKRIK